MPHPNSGTERGLKLDLKACLREGDLVGALKVAIEDVKKEPLDADRRLAMFACLCFTGDLDRAAKQLDVIADASMERAYGASALLAMVSGERQRREVLAGNVRPDFLGEDTEWAEPWIRAAKETVSTDELEAARPAVSGTINGNAFEDLRDGDDQLAPFIELVAAGRYVWLGLHQIKRMTTKEPRVLLDTCWMTVDLELTTGQECPGVIPVLYSGSHESSDGALQLGHATDWKERNGLTRGVGRRMLYANGEEIDLLSVRELTTGD